MKRELLVALLLTGLCGMPLWAAQAQPGVPEAAGQEAAAPPYNPQGTQVPPELTLPAGTLISVRTTQFLSSDRNRPGDGFTAIIDQPLVAQGWVVSRRGQTATGVVSIAQKSRNTSQLGIELGELPIVDGLQVPVRTQLIRTEATRSQRSEVAGVGAATGIGAVIGAIAGGGQGAAIGAAVGAAAGVAGVMVTRGRPAEIYPESILTFRLEEPVTISTQQSQQAFLPVTDRDYNQGPAPQRYPETRPGYRAEAYPPPPPPPYYYGPYYGAPYYGWYAPPPGVYFGIYTGPRYYVRPGFGFYYRGYRRRW